MTRAQYSLWLVVAGVAAAAWIAGCQTTGSHAVADQSASQPMMCQACYDRTQLARQEKVKGVGYRLIRKHTCKDCGTETTIYEQDGKIMMKCRKCAPDGVACDKCQPPKKGLLGGIRR